MEYSPDPYRLEGVEIHPDPGSLAYAAAEHFVILAKEAIASRGRFAVALSGGSTPKAMYSLLATDEFATRLAWTQVHLFWGDERCVPPDHPDSNFRTAFETLINHVPLPPGNVHRMHGEIEPTQSADEYERVLRDFFLPSPDQIQAETAIARFDLILLGMGNDGHTASLFPGTATIQEQVRWVVALYVEKLRVWRLSLTPVAINAAANVIFVVSGAGKAERLRQVLTGPYQPGVLPAQVVRPDRGRLLWLVDAAAATSLSGGS